MHKNIVRGRATGNVICRNSNCPVLSWWCWVSAPVVMSVQNDCHSRLSISRDIVCCMYWWQQCIAVVKATLLVRVCRLCWSCGVVKQWNLNSPREQWCFILSINCLFPYHVTSSSELSPYHHQPSVSVSCHIVIINCLSPYHVTSSLLTPLECVNVDAFRLTECRREICGNQLNIGKFKWKLIHCG